MGSTRVERTGGSLLTDLGRPERLPGGSDAWSVLWAGFSTGVNADGVGVWDETWCICYFSPSHDKIPYRSSLRKKVFVFTCVWRLQSSTVEQAGQPKHERVNHVSATRKQRDELVPVHFLLFILSSIPAYGIVL